MTSFQISVEAQVASRLCANGVHGCICLPMHLCNLSSCCTASKCVPMSSLDIRPATSLLLWFFLSLCSFELRVGCELLLEGDFFCLSVLLVGSPTIPVWLKGTTPICLKISSRVLRGAVSRSLLYTSSDPFPLLWCPKR